MYKLVLENTSKEARFPVFMFHTLFYGALENKTKNSMRRHYTQLLTHASWITVFYYTKINISEKLTISNINDFLVHDNTP
jgi:hypothetical protein